MPEGLMELAEHLKLLPMTARLEQSINCADSIVDSYSRLPSAQRNSSPVTQSADPDLLRAVSTTVELALRFHPVADDLAAAMRAGGRERVYGTLKAIKGVGLAGQPNFKCLVVVIAAQIASSHGITSDYKGYEITYQGSPSFV